MNRLLIWAEWCAIALSIASVANIASIASIGVWRFSEVLGTDHGSARWHVLGVSGCYRDERHGLRRSSGFAIALGRHWHHHVAHRLRSLRASLWIQWQGPENGWNSWYPCNAVCLDWWLHDGCIGVKLLISGLGFTRFDEVCRSFVGSSLKPWIRWSDICKTTGLWWRKESRMSSWRRGHVSFA